MRTKLTVVCAAVALVAIAGGSAQATGLMHTGNIANGAVTFGKLSPHVQQLIGANGGAGANGATGGTGATGATGATGLTGAKGATGDTGPQGPAGTNAPIADAIPGPAGPAGIQGLTGPQGSKGDTGSQGPKGDAGAAGAKGADGSNGSNGVDGANGENPAIPVLAAGDGGWQLDGATLAGGELVLKGGFDASSEQGALGATRAYPNTPLLSTLNALSFAYHRDVRNSGADSVSIHLSVFLNGTTGFDNLVYNTYYNGANPGGPSDFQQSYNQNAMRGVWWSTHALPLITGSATQGAQVSLATIQAAYPNATILQVSLDNGDSSAGTTAGADFSAGADNMLIGFGSTFSRYDFGG